VDAKGDDGRTPLDWAVDLGYTEITDLLGSIVNWIGEGGCGQ